VSSVYSPERRTAVVFAGTGAHGAYHAGVLRALEEAGVKVDLVAGHGVGAANAALAAIAGQAQLWDAHGVWRTPRTRDWYGWKGPVRWAGWLVVALLAALVAPVLLVVATGVVVYPIGFLLETAGSGYGTSLLAAYAGWLQTAFAGPRLPTFVPRLGMILVSALVLLVLAAAVRAAREGWARRGHGAVWWWVFGAPFDAMTARRAFIAAVWHLIRGAASVTPPPVEQIGRRYADVLLESLGQPGFRELIVIATDLDSRRDLVGALVSDPYAQPYLAARPDRDRRAEVLDLAGAGRDRAIDLMAAALTPAVGFDPWLVTFAPDSHWRGETHRLIDRPGAVHRLLEEVAAAGVTQIVVVSACAPESDPHRLRSTALDPRQRLGEFIVAAEAAALRDALEMARLRFDAVFTIRPSHNALGPFDFAGAYDQASDRRQEMAELIDRGYEDAGRQFIEPVVGASGEYLAQTHAPAADVGAAFRRPWAG
jgi:hypothetical protein